VLQPLSGGRACPSAAASAVDALALVAWISLDGEASMSKRALATTSSSCVGATALSSGHRRCLRRAGPSRGDFRRRWPAPGRAGCTGHRAAVRSAAVVRRHEGRAAVALAGGRVRRAWVVVVVLQPLSGGRACPSAAASAVDALALVACCARRRCAVKASLAAPARDLQLRIPDSTDVQSLDVGLDRVVVLRVPVQVHGCVEVQQCLLVPL